MAAATFTLLVAACANEPAERTPLQQLDWRNGPYADPCALDEEPEYVDGQTVRADGKESSTGLSGVGHAELDGRAGDEAVLTHSCLTGAVSLTVWTGSDEGPRLLGSVEPPADLVDVRDWSADQGVLCVLFNATEPGDPDAPAEARAVRVSADGLTVLDQACEVEDA